MTGQTAVDAGRTRRVRRATGPTGELAPAATSARPYAVDSFHVRKARQPTRLGELILSRMTDLGMQRQVDLVRASTTIAPSIGLDTGISDSTVSRLIYTDDYMPDRDTLALLARTLRVDFDELVLFVFRGAEGQKPAVVGEQIHWLAAELNRILTDDSPEHADDRAAIEDLVDRVIEPTRKWMRRKHRSA
jgi:transcriptional regulator with XRE-family HTH domain